jgi:NAD(P)-dependent dehydrogenase (short-subunit alcohol dehydrogenase family)
MSADFSGKVVLVAGGTGGLGRAVSLAFLESGAQVAVTWRHENEFVSLRDAADGAASRLAGFDADVTDVHRTTDLASQILAKWGRLDARVIHGASIPVFGNA